MRFVDFKKGCEPQALTVAHTSSPQLTSGKVLIKVHAFGVNRADTLQRQGHYPPPPGESDILGLEVAGEVLEVADDVSQWQVGDRVFGLVAGGGYAEEVTVLATHLMATPQNLSDAEAAGLTEVFVTAFQCLRTISHVKPAQRVLIHGGASGVGLAATQLCRYWGVEAAVTASSEQKLDYCQQQGAALPINYKQQDFAEIIKQAWPEGVDMVLDMVGGDYLNRNLKVLKLEGIVVYLAMLAGRYADNLDMALLIGKRATIQGTTLRSRSDTYKSQLIEDFATTCLPAFASGELKVNIDTIYTVDEVARAHARLEANDSQGKIVVTWP